MFNHPNFAQDQAEMQEDFTCGNGFTRTASRSRLSSRQVQWETSMAPSELRTTRAAPQYET
jgi:hypothetical protein